jgi:ribonuclease D
VWADRDPDAAERLGTVRPLLQEAAEQLNIPVENLLTPDFLRRIAWRPPSIISQETVGAELKALGAREWQVELVAPIITTAFLNPQPLPPRTAREAKPAEA